MQNKAEFFLFLLLLTCSSCSSIYRFSVDVQEPALITLPVSAQNVLILNNAVAQPQSYGIEQTFDEQPVGSNLDLDTLVWLAINEIATVFNESNFFNTVAFYRNPIRTDTEWASIKILSPEEQSDFYYLEDYDALLTIDRLLFSVKNNVKKVRTGAFFVDSDASVDLRIDGIITCSMYAYGKETPEATFTLSDSLFTKSPVSNDSILLFKHIPEYLLGLFSRQIGNKAATRFIPTWQTEERMLFTGQSSRIKEAVGYARNNRWAGAETIWMAEMEKTTKPEDRAKLAYNLAVVNEMQDKFEPALAWLQQTKEYLRGVSNSEMTELTDKYIAALERRIQNNRLLDLQWGIE
jgi:hypothetical protein